MPFYVIFYSVQDGTYSEFRRIFRYIKIIYISHLRIFNFKVIYFVLQDSVLLQGMKFLLNMSFKITYMLGENYFCSSICNILHRTFDSRVQGDFERWTSLRSKYIWTKQYSRWNLYNSENNLYYSTEIEKWIYFCS